MQLSKVLFRFFRLVGLTCAVLSGSAPLQAFDAPVGHWLRVGSFFSSDSPFAPYRSQLLRITDDVWTEADILGENHDLKSYSAFYAGTETVLVDKNNRERTRFLRIEGDRLHVCWDEERIKCDDYERTLWPMLNSGFHPRPRFRTSVTWVEGELQHDTQLSIEQSQELLSSNYADTSPQWSRILHPNEQSTQRVIYGVTVFTALVGEDPQDLSAYRASLTLWAGIPNGSGMYVIPFAVQKNAHSMASGKNMVISGEHAGRTFHVDINFQAVDD